MAAEFSTSAHIFLKRPLNPKLPLALPLSVSPLSCNYGSKKDTGRLSRIYVFYINASSDNEVN